MANKSDLPPLQPGKALKIPVIIPFNYDNAFGIDNWSIMDVVCALMEDELRASRPAKFFLKHGILTIDPCIINEDDKGRNHLLSLMLWVAGEDNDNSERTPLSDLAKACKAFSGGKKLGSVTSDGCYCPPLSDEDERTIPLDLLLMSFILPDNKETRNDYPALKNTKEWRIWGENVASLRETILRTISYLSDSKLFGDKNKPIKSLDEILGMLSSTMGKETIIPRLKNKVFPYLGKREINVPDSYKELVDSKSKQISAPQIKTTPAKPRQYGATTKKAKNDKLKRKIAGFLKVKAHQNLTPSEFKKKMITPHVKNECGLKDNEPKDKTLRNWIREARRAAGLALPPGKPKK